jgi:phosphoribosylamine--glycine ligase
MERHGIPTAEFVVAHDSDEAAKAARKFGYPVVLKADGLAAGKGVLIPKDDEELDKALKMFFDERRFGASGDRVVVEECLEGEEVSAIALSDGKRLIPFVASKDYKRIGEDDTGPNTGGMGAHSPAGVLNVDLGKGILDKVMRPMIEGLAEENRTFVGVLYAGLMVSKDSVKVLEFNVRFGDPETQPLMLRLEDDLLPVLAAGAAGNFDGQRLHFRKEAAACIVLASVSYPGTPKMGETISGEGQGARGGRGLPRRYGDHGRQSGQRRRSRAQRLCHRAGAPRCSQAGLRCGRRDPLAEQVPAARHRQANPHPRLDPSHRVDIAQGRCHNGAR